MKISKRFAIVLGIVIPLIGILILCGIGLTEVLGLGKCDFFDSHLTDSSIRNEFFTAVSDFARQHDLDISGGDPICSFGSYSTLMEYRTPLRFSKYGITYRMFLTVTYFPYSRTVELQIPELFSETDDVLKYIDTLDSLIGEFENTLQVDEFTSHFEQEGIDLYGIVLRDVLWIETDPSVSKTYGDIFFSIPTHSIESYYLPSRITWKNFPEVSTIYKIVNKHLQVDEVSNCTISTKRDSSARITVHFYPEIPSISTGVSLLCGSLATDKFLSIVLHPDGSYELDELK